MKRFAPEIILLLLFTTCGLVQLQAQTADQYTYSTGTGASLDPMIGASTIVASGEDDTPSDVNNLGFNFIFEGISYSQFSASPDGFMKLGGTAAISQFTNQITSVTNTPKFFPWWDDLSTGTDGSVRFITSGISPNRKCIVEWFVTVPRDIASAANARMQCWLYETSNVIEFRYGSVTGDAGSIGIRSASASSLFQSVTSATNACSNASANDSNAVFPAAGRFYRFSIPPTCNTEPDLGTFISAANLCNGSSTSLRSTVIITTIGVTYTWQEFNGSIWVTATGGTGVNTSVFTTPALSGTSKQYRLTAICTNTGLSSMGSTITITWGNAPLSLPVREGFNTGTSIAACWTTEVVNNPGGVAPTLVLTSSSTQPTVASPEGPQFIKFNSYIAAFGAQIRLASPVLNTIGNTSIDVSFLMHEFYSIPWDPKADLVILQYSLDGGTTWVNTDSNRRSNVNLTRQSGSWFRRYFTLPPAVLNQTNLKIGLLFNSAFGWNVYVDDIAINEAINLPSTGDCSDSLTLKLVCGPNKFRAIARNGGAVVEIIPSNQDLGDMGIKYFVNTGPVRQDSKMIYYLDRNYEMRASVVPGLPVGVRFYFSHAEYLALQSVNPFANLSNMMATRVSGAPGEYCSSLFIEGNTNVTLLPSSIYDDHANGHYVYLQSTGFSQFFLYEDATNRVLPPTELLFNVLKKQSYNLLAWTAFTENRISHYIIERSSDGQQWYPIGNVAAFNRINVSYEFRDNEPLKGKNYYRLKQVSLQLRQRLSVIRMVEINDSKDFTVYPNPAETFLNISFIAEKNNEAKMEVVNAGGQIVLKKEFRVITGVNNLSLDISTLKPGIYMLRQFTSEAMNIKQFIKL